jgi:Hpt domain
MLTELRTRLTAASGAGGSPAGVADINAARAVLHKLKGSALTLGAAAVGACCDAVRQHCLAGDMAALHAPGGSLAMLEAATQQVLGARVGVGVCMHASGDVYLRRLAIADMLNRYIALQTAIVNAGV